MFLYILIILTIIGIKITFSRTKHSLTVTTYRIGDVFIFVTLDEAQEMIEEKKANVATETKNLREKQDNIKQMMSDLKVQLYAKFGSNINLEPE